MIEPSDALTQALGKLERDGPPGLADRLARLVRTVAQEAAHNDRFAAELVRALSGEDAVNEPGTMRPARPHRRAPGVFDPFEVYAESEQALRDRLAELDIEQLKDIIAEHGMDRDRLAMRWKTSSRLIDRIVETVVARAAKGGAFLR